MQHIETPITTLQCHGKWFVREVKEKGRRFEKVYGTLATYTVRDWPQTRILINNELPPEGFYAVG